MDLRRIKTYVISPGVGKYEARLRNTMSKLKKVGFEDIEHVASVPDESVTNSLSLTNVLIFEKEKGNTYPFIIIEDDVEVEDTVADETWTISIPEDAVAVYLGVSLWNYPFEYHTLSCGKNIRLTTEKDFRSHDDRLVRIGGMTSTHAILFVDRDRSFTQTLSLSIRSYLRVRTPHDLIMATLQKIYPVYAFKLPFFYQAASEGGQQAETRLIWFKDRYYSRK